MLIYTSNSLQYLNLASQNSHERNNEMQMIYSTLRKLGLTSNYRGFHFLSDAIHLAIQNQFKPIFITKDIYPQIAQKYNTTPCNVEKCISIAINACWVKNRNGMNRIAGFQLTYKPTNSEFIDMVAYCLSELDDE